MNHTIVLVIAITLGGEPNSAQKQPNGREVVESFVAAALEGKVDEAMALAVEGQGPSKKQIEEFPKLLSVKALKIANVLASDKRAQAIAVSEAVKLTKANPDGRDTGALVFALVKSGDKWLVKDIDFRTEGAAKERLKAFEKKNPDAKELPAESRR